MINMYNSNKFQYQRYIFITDLPVYPDHELVKNEEFYPMSKVMQSIPAVPIAPGATAGHLLTLSVPGVGH